MDLDVTINKWRTEQCREVYFVQARRLELIKIGVADDAGKRLRDLALVSPDELQVLGVMPCRNFGKTEEGLHEQFKRERHHGEWFIPTQRLKDFITAHAWNPVRAKLLQAICDKPTMPRGRPRKNAA